MAINKIHSVSKVVLGGSSGITLPGIKSGSVNFNIRKVVNYAGGIVDPQYIAVMDVAPVISVTFTDIAIGLGKFALGGLVIPQTTVYTTIDFWLVSKTNDASARDFTDAFRVRASAGLIVPKNISARQGGEATMTIEIHPTYDGSNEILIVSDAQTLSDSNVVAEKFTVGPLNVNGSAVPGIQGVDIDFGINVGKNSSGGAARPETAYINSRKFMATFDTLEVPTVATYGVLGTAQSSTASNFYLRKLSKNGSRVADGTAQHIKFTTLASLGLISPESVGGSNNEDATVKLAIEPIDDGTNAPITISTGSAIT